jgi:hypothetical protein
MPAMGSFWWWMMVVAAVALVVVYLKIKNRGE